MSKRLKKISDKSLSEQTTKTMNSIEEKKKEELKKPSPQKTKEVSK